MSFFHFLAAASLSVSISVPVIFSAGTASPSGSTLLANPNTATADGVATLPLVFAAKDVFNNPVSGVGVSLSASGTNNMFGATSGVTDANGRFMTVLSSTLVQNEVVTATFGNSNSVTAMVAFVPGPASASTSSLVVSPNSTIANNSNTLTAVLTLRDAQGNALSGVMPSFSASGASNTITPSGNTSGSGQASATYRTTLAQNENATCAVAGITLSAPMTFVAGPVAAAASTLTANPNSAPGNGTATISLVTTARDAQGNGVSGKSVALSASGGNTTFGAASGTTLANGTYTTTIKSTQMQTETITARIANTFNVTASVAFVGNPNAKTSTLAVDANTQTVGPGNVITATLTLRDANSNLIAGVVPTWSGSGSNNTIVSSGASSSAGVATATYASTLAQNENVQVAASGISLFQPVRFLAGSPNMASSYMYSNPGRQIANNSNTITASIMILDAYNNGVAGQATTFTASGSNTTVTSGGITDSTGLAQALYKTGTIQNQNALASAAGFTLSTPMIFTDVPASCVLSVSPASQTANGTSALTLTAAVSNASAQPIPGIPVVFSSSGAAQNFAPQNVVTTAAGQAVSSTRSLYAGRNNFLAQAANVQCASQGNFVTRSPYCTGNPNLAYTTYATSNYVYSMVVADFNGDGKQDLAVANTGGSTFGILIGTGTGSFQPQSTYAMQTDNFSLAAADFNGDGNIDLATANGGANSITIFFGLGTGNFQMKGTYATGAGSYPNQIVTSDIDNDGSQDIVIINGSNSTIGVLLNTGIGTFRNQVLYTAGAAPYSLAIGDFNGDGKKDLVVANYSDNTVGVLLGAGTGTFQSQVAYSTGTNSGVYWVGIGDFNGDGAQDIAVVNNISNTLGLFRGTGTGTFQTQVTYATGNGPNSLTIGDLNGDGIQDLVVTNGNAFTLGIFIGTGTGTMKPQVSYTAGSSPDIVVTGDFNADGKQDVAIANRDDSTVGVYVNRCP